MPTGRRRRDYRPRMFTTASMRRLIRERDGDFCYVCGQLIDFGLEPGTEWGPTLEHVVPRKMFGRDEPPNLKLSHGRCNRDRDYAEVEDDIMGRWREQTRRKA